MENENIRLRLTARAIIVNDNHLLICNVKERSYTYLPGGEVNPGESIKDALKREIDEELKKVVDIKKYVGYIDQQFVLNEEKIHEITHLFMTKLVNIDTTEQLETYNEVPSVRWVPINQLEGANLMPKIIQTTIPKLFKNLYSDTLEININEIDTN